MKTLLLLLAFLHLPCFAQWTPEPRVTGGIALVVVSADSFAQWTLEQRLVGGIALVAVAADWAQTRYISRHPVQFEERNRLILGSAPSSSKINAYFVAMPLLGYLAADALPSEYRTHALRIAAALQIASVGHNYSIGIKMRF